MSEARGLLFEKLVSDVWNDWDVKYRKLTTDQRKKSFDDMVQGAWYAVRELKQHIKTTEIAKKISTAEVNEKWTGNKYGEPKTDVSIGNYHISLKYGPAQIMSSSPEEIKAVLNVATSNINKTEIIIKIINSLNDLVEIKNTGDVIAKKITIKDKYIDTKTGKERVKGISNIIEEDKNIYYMLEQIKEKHKELQNDFIKLFNDEQIKYKFIEESLTGKVKYNGNLGTATHLLSFSKKENKHIFKPFDENTIKEISNMSNISMSFKSSGTLTTIDEPNGKRNAWSVLRIIMGELEDDNEINIS